ncbi:MAG: hypothetical protein C4523_00365 [Myxococcales bacterium]|nr:MAG: hypothetical protein C4523_00365 [Myxococcales bacterium]
MRLAFAVILALIAFAAPAWAARWGYSGAKTISNADLLPHPLDSLSYMEQWSGTAVFAKNHTLNFNLIHSSLTTKSDKAVFRVEYNTPDGKTVEDAERCTIRSESNPVKLVCGSSILLASTTDMSIVFVGKKLQVTAKLTSLSKPFRPKNGRILNPDNSKEFYDFWLVIPRGKALAKINGNVLKGYGSADHSYTNTGYHKISRHWLRTTYHDNDVSILFAVNQLKDGRSAAWAAVATDAASYATADLTATLANPLPDSGKDGYFAPRNVTLVGSGGFTLNVPGMSLKSKSDMLDGLSTVEAFVARRFSDPMRYAMEGTAQVQWTANGQPATTSRPVVVVVKQMNE